MKHVLRRGHVQMMSAQGEGGGNLTADAVRKPDKEGCVKMQEGGGHSVV